MLFGPMPTWTVEPGEDVILKIARRELALPVDAHCDIEFVAEGSFNRIYKVKYTIDGNDTVFVMRVTLPVHPRSKTLCEVATIEFLGQHTDIPLAKILKHEATFDNELGFEWMIQDFRPGESLEDA